jgi:steroid delta-isomerase-like uncharacterized protein
MSRSDTLRLIARYFEAFNVGDHDAMLACLHEEVVHDINEGDREIGRDKFRWFLGMMSRHYRETLSNIVIMTDEDGRRAAAEFTVRGTYLATAPGLPEARGQNYSLPAGIFFEIEDGLIARVTTYYNLRDWVSQVEGD